MRRRPPSLRAACSTALGPVLARPLDADELPIVSPTSCPIGDAWSMSPPDIPPLPRAAQSSAYLNQSLEALTAASSAPALYADVADYYHGSLLESAQRRLSAMNRRLGFLRSAVLFAALSAEAYANEFLEATLLTPDVQALDRLVTSEKLLIGTRLVGVQPPLDRGKLPLQRLYALFEVRNALVHPRRSGAKSISAYAHNVTEQDKDLVGPKAAAGYIVAVAELTVQLEPHRPGVSIIGEATVIVEHRAVLDAHRKVLGDEILVVPDEDAAAPAPLLVQMQRRAAKRARQSSAEHDPGE
jgi:hypothetical protein